MDFEAQDDGVAMMYTNSDFPQSNNAATGDDLRSSLLAAGNFRPKSLGSMKRGMDSYIKTIDEMKRIGKGSEAEGRKISFAC